MQQQHQQHQEFVSEAAFEDAVVHNLTRLHGWSKAVLNSPTEQDLIENWAEIIFKNNNTLERLNGVPLSKSEIETLVQAIAQRINPTDMHRLLQGKELTLRRDNVADKRNHGQNIQLTIFNPAEIAGGDSTYQIARQPKFSKKIQTESDRRGDLVLLIWGLPLIHLELKSSTQTVSKAIVQMQRYMDQQIFSGLMNAVQVMVALTPDDIRYFARPVDADALNPNFMFKWTDKDNEWYPSWRGIVQSFLGIPQAHRLVGDYMIADRGDEVLKVLRPYQIYAVEAILDKMHEINALDAVDWSRNTHKGGYIWHTTGSGKTMTSFKTATLLARKGLADKVVFVLDRIELSDQSMLEYLNFADDSTEINKPSSAWRLLGDMKDRSKRLILTTIHKFGDLCGSETNVGEADFEKMRNQRIVFVIDEAHRSTFGDMFRDLTRRFPNAVFIGFTGTPIQWVNERKGVVTSNLFGDELHRYSIYYGLRDKNVLEFETVGVNTFDDLREAVALRKAGAYNIDDVMRDPIRLAIFDKYMDEKEVPMASYVDEQGNNVIGIEKIAGSSSWDNVDHRLEVVNYINKHWARRSRGGRLHALLAANSVLEAISYYRLLKKHTELKVTAVFTDQGEHTKTSLERDRGIREILQDYNTRYNTAFAREDLASFKVDVSSRLAHKDAYKGIENFPEKQVDLVVVVDQLLTGYDSKWLNTLYFDRVFTYDRLVQAFSRTNRVLDAHLKPHGTIVYFRMVNTMAVNIDEAFELYSGNRARDVFTDALPEVLTTLNAIFADLAELFRSANVMDYEKLPDDTASRRKFALLFSELSRKLEAALVQGFDWGVSHYEFPELSESPSVTVELTEQIYDALLARYSELGTIESDETSEDIPLDLSTLAIVNQAQRIDFEYLDAKFDKYREALKSPSTSDEEKQLLLEQVQAAYASLSQEDQAIARQIVTDIQASRIDPNKNMKFQEHLAQYKVRRQETHAVALHKATGIPIETIDDLLTISDGTPETLVGFGRLAEVQECIDYDVFRQWLKEEKDLELAPFDEIFAAEQLLRYFFLNDGVDPAEWETSEF